jgi:hypothetical protein
MIVDVFFLIVLVRENAFKDLDLIYLAIGIIWNSSYTLNVSLIFTCWNKQTIACVLYDLH